MQTPHGAGQSCVRQLNNRQQEKSGGKVRIKIANDLFDIADRIKELDRRYEIYFDTVKNKYLLTDEKGVVQLVVPYENLDARTLGYAYHTRAENADELEEEAEKHNDEIVKLGIKETQDKVENDFSRELRLRKI
jgi:hypothetical protein